jgi:hypothetical protein
VTPARRPALAAALLLTLLPAACGGRDAPPPSAGGWAWAKLEGLANATGVTVHRGDLLLVAGGGDTALHVVPLAGLRHGGTARARRVEFQTHPNSRLEGRDDGDGFLSHGYDLGDLWPQGVDFQGVATRTTTDGWEFLYVAERSYRVVYRGRLDRAPTGEITSAVLQTAFPVPGANRSASKASDWRDKGAGLAGIVSAGERRVAEDLYVAERESPEPGRFRIFKTDMFGQPLLHFTVRLAGEPPAAVEDVSFADERFVVVRGPGRGLLVSIQDPGAMGLAAPRAGVPGPELPGAGPWQGIAHDPAGTVYLVSHGPETLIAWRR